MNIKKIDKRLYTKKLPITDFTNTQLNLGRLKLLLDEGVSGGNLGVDNDGNVVISENGGSPSTGTTDHRKLKFLDEANQHPMVVITGLLEKHSEQDSKIQVNTDNVQAIIDGLSASDFLIFMGAYNASKTDYKLGSVVQQAQVLYLCFSQDNPPSNSILDTNYWNVFTGDVDLDNYYTKIETDTRINTKQNKLIAGQNISITGETISASVTAELNDYYTKVQTDVKFDEKQNTLIAGENISISGNTISATVTAELEDYYTKIETDTKVDAKQNELIAGANVSITGDTISMTGSSNVPTGTEIPTDLPEGTLYFRFTTGA